MAFLGVAERVPPYVPQAVLQHTAAIVDGEPGTSDSWIDLLAKHEGEIRDAKKTFDTLARKKVDDEELDFARRAVLTAIERRAKLEADVTCIQRLVFDSRMEAVYKLLQSEFDRPTQLTGFVYAAWSARSDYAKERARSKEANALLANIATSASDLATYLKRLQLCGLNVPPEMFALRNLLSIADCEGDPVSQEMWRYSRRHLTSPGSATSDEHTNLERKPTTSSKASSLRSASQIEVRYVNGPRPRIDAAQKERVALAWSYAPELPALLLALARVARKTTLTPDERVRIATRSRQRNTKTEYLRAFGSVLVNVHSIELTHTVKRAIAITANVVIDNPAVDVTPDDVRKALRN